MLINCPPVNINTSWPVDGLEDAMVDSKRLFRFLTYAVIIEQSKQAWLVRRRRGQALQGKEHSPTGLFFCELFQIVTAINVACV